MIPGDIEYAEPGGFAEMVNRVLMAIFSPCSDERVVVRGVRRVG